MYRKRRKKQRNFIILSVISLLFVMSIGYAAFSTNLNITAKGIIKDLKTEVDKKVPMDGLLFWGQADNKENTLALLKDKSGKNNDGVMNGFDNTVSSGYNDGILEFDGVNDYVNIGFANYDFKNSISYVLYAKLNSSSSNIHIFGNWKAAGGGLELSAGSYGNMVSFNNFKGGVSWNYVVANDELNYDIYHTLVGTYDSNYVKLYIDGILQQSKQAQGITNSPSPIYIGWGPDRNPYISITKMSFKEAMLYDRALTEEEVKIISEGFDKKFK